MRDHQRNRLGVVMKYAGIAMALVYILLGSFILARGRQSLGLPAGYVFPFGLSLIAYGLFRGWRIYSIHFKPDRYEDHDILD